MCLASGGATCRKVSPRVSPGTGEHCPAGDLGSSQDGQSLSASTGTWSNNPVVFAVEWLRCDGGGGSCQVIAGATGYGYRLRTEDIGHTIRVSIRAGNGGGLSDGAVSEATARVTPGPPVVAVGPITTGIPVTGQQLTFAYEASFNGTPPFTYSYAWLRCLADGTNCTQVPGATDRFYNLTSADVPFRIVGRIVAANGYGSGNADASSSEVIREAPVTCPESAPTPGNENDPDAPEYGEFNDDEELRDALNAADRVDPALAGGFDVEDSCPEGSSTNRLDPAGSVCYLSRNDPPRSEIGTPGMFFGDRISAFGYSECRGTTHGKLTRVYTACIQRYLLAFGKWQNRGKCSKSVAKGLARVTFGDGAPCDQRVSRWRMRVTLVSKSDIVAKKSRTSGEVVLNCFGT